MSLFLVVLVILLLVALNGFFVAAEFALIGTPRTLIEKEADSGNALAKRVLSILITPKSQDRYIATAQLGITLVSLGLGMYGEHQLAGILGDWFSEVGWAEGAWFAAHSAASVVSVTFLTYLHIVLGEMIPKSLALQAPHRVAQWITPPMQLIEWILYPLVILLNGLGNLILRIMRVRRQDVGHFKTPEELSYIVDESETGGELGRESANVLRELLEFGELTAGEAMVPRTQIVGIPLGATSEQIRDMIRKRPHTRYLVYDGDLDKAAGFVHVKDLLRSIRISHTLSISEVRTMPFVPASSSLETVLRSMREFKSQLAVVMDEHGGTAGLITVEDLFEEVVGEISEDQAEKPEIVEGVHGSWTVRGTARLFDLAERMGVDLEHEDVDTVSGLILALLERPAQLGDEVEYRGTRFRVSALGGRGVAECTVCPPEPRVTSAEEASTSS